MALSTKTFIQLVQDQAAAVQSRSTQILDFTTGSVMRAFTESNAAVGMWLQAMALKILTMTRLATSQGVDVDSWVNDWGVFRLSATVASGSVTYSRFTPQTAVVIPIGAQVQTADGTQIFQVVLDATNGAYSLASNGYVLPIAVSSVTVPVQSISGSSAANVASNTITVLLTNIIGVDTVTNALAFVGGSNAETDAQLRARFINYISSLSKGTVGAIQYAITSLQLGLKATIIENYAANGVYTPGLLTITVDDGSGAPRQSLLTSVSAAVANVRSAGINWVVLAPIVSSVNIFVTLNKKTGYDPNTVIATVATAITAYVNSLSVGDGMAYLKLSQIIYDATPGVDSISGLNVNGLLKDIAGDPRTVIKLATLTVS